MRRAVMARYRPHAVTSGISSGSIIYTPRAVVNNATGNSCREPSAVSLQTTDLAKLGAVESPLAQRFP